MVPAGRGALAEYRINGGISVQETYSDNVNLAPDGEDRRSDLFTQISPFVTIRGKSARTSGALNFAHDRFISLNDTQGDSVQNRLTATGQAELWKHVAFLNGQASISQQLTNPLEPVVDSPVGQLRNRTEVRSVRLNPTFRHHFGTYLETLTSVSLGRVETKTDELKSRTMLSSSFDANTGRRFTRFRLGFGVTTSQAFADSGDNQTTSDTHAGINGSYRISRSVSVNGSAGYRLMVDDTLDHEPNEATWRVGGTWRPSSRTSFTLGYGHDYGRDSVSFQGNQRVGRRASVTANYTESISTSQVREFDNISFIGVAEDGTLIDLRTGLPFAASTEDFPLQNAASYNRSFTLAFTGATGKTSYSGNLRYTERETDATDANDQVYGGGLTLSRALARRASARVNLDYRHSELGAATRNQYNASVGLSLGYRAIDTSFTARYTFYDFQKGGSDSHDIQFAAALSYHFFKDISANLGYNLIRRLSNDGDLLENSVSLGLTKTF